MKTNPINSENLYHILPFKVSQLTLLYAKKHNINVIEALKKIYKSTTYKRLEKEDTKLWHLGPVALLECMEEWDG